MKDRKKILYMGLLLYISTAITAQAFMDIESGIAFYGYNDVRIPGDSGTLLSLSETTPAGPILILRLRIGYTFNDSHSLSILAAPLTVEGSGVIEEDVTYQDKTFTGGTLLTSKYRFDSYRLTYRWDFMKLDKITAGIGITVKLRSADIALMDDTGYVNRDDLGVVPLINFRSEWFFYDNWGVVLDGDALVTPFGRAEDIQLALLYKPKTDVLIRIGYRVLEGGADGGGNVYTFSLFNYLTAGITVSF